MKLNNPFIGYITRSYLQIKQDVLTKFQNKVPEITDHTDTNPWVKGISIWASIAEMLGYYIDASAREVFLSTATLFSSVAKIAKMFDYRIRGVLAASVDVTFYIDAPAGEDINIPSGTVIKTNDNVEFQTVSPAVLVAGNTEVVVSAVQQILVSDVVLGVSDGSANITYELESNVVDNQIVVTVDADIYKPVDTFAFSTLEDTVFVAGKNENETIDIRFPDGVNGKIPASGKNIVAEYSVSSGAGGNVASGTIIDVATVVPVPPGVTLRVTNNFAASGGADSEDIVTIKKKLPLSIRTLYRAVTLQDYIDIAALAPGVNKAGVKFDCATTIELYIVPLGGGIASNQLLIDVEEYFEDKRIIGRQINANSAGEVNLIIQADIYVLPNFVRSNVLSQARTNMLTFLSAERQEVNGKVQIGDLYEILEETQGVDYSKIKLVISVPFARPLDGDTNLNLTVKTLPASNTTVKWLVKMVNVTDYELYKNGTYIGTFATGQKITQTEVEFTVNAGVYTPGERWEFVSYAYNSAVELDEPSVPVTKTQYLEFQGFGGL